ncbi:MAG: IS630 family transposase [Bacteriovoracales bacterium]|nr:IS630 family transposase [Bacteriovoracales bacterium]
MGKFLTLKQRQELLDELKLERIRRYADRLRVILLLDEGQTYKNIAKFLFLDEGTIGNYKKRYKKGGIEGLINDQYFGRKAMLSPKEMAILSNDLQSRIFPTAKSVINHIKKKFGVKYSEGGATDLLHRLGFSFKKATPVPGKGEREKQEAFVRQYRRLKPLGKIYFTDATHPEFAPTISYGWIKKGTNFDVKTNSGWRKRVNICGALDIDGPDIIARTYKTIDSAAICDLLSAIRRGNPSEDKIYVILDGAAYNRSRRTKEFAWSIGVKLIYLPPYSPNLNLIERLWKFMKKKVTANRYYEEFDDFKKSLTTFFRTIRKYHPELESLLRDNFPILGT